MTIVNKVITVRETCVQPVLQGLKTSISVQMIHNVNAVMVPMHIKMKWVKPRVKRVFSL